MECMKITVCMYTTKNAQVRTGTEEINTKNNMVSDFIKLQIIKKKIAVLI